MMLRWLLILVFSLGAAELSSIGEAPNSMQPELADSINWDSIPLTPLQDSIYSDSTATRAFMERNYQHKQQVVVGTVIMLCVALLMVAMNNYNPRR